MQNNATQGQTTTTLTEVSKECQLKAVRDLVAKK